MEEKEKKSNRFVRFVKGVFARNLLIKAAAFMFGGFLWLLLIALGFGNDGGFDHTRFFFDTVTENVIAAFTGTINIVASAVDLVLLILLVYVIFKFLHKYNAGLLLRFIVPLLLLAVVCTSKLLDLPVMGYLFSNIVLILAVAILVMFPQELRRGIWKLASPSESESFKTQYDCTEDELRAAAIDIVRAVLNMSKINEGALIIIVNQTIPQHVIDSGTRLDAVLSQHLIECLFNTKTNLHDGAVVIRGNRIVSAGCFLPLTQSQSLPKELGTRHRAAMGMTEQYPVLAVIVSEETGIISVCRNGQLDRYYDAQMLSDVIEQTFGLKVATKAKKKRVRRLF